MRAALEARIRALTRQNEDLAKQNEDLKKENDQLKSQVKSYQQSLVDNAKKKGVFKTTEEK
jgi:FtsZ-binding cell division protein ZapB